jgi:hypothetical protein
MQPKLFTYFSSDTFKKVRKVHKANYCAELEQKLAYANKRIAGFEGYINSKKIQLKK